MEFLIEGFSSLTTLIILKDILIGFFIGIIMVVTGIGGVLIQPLLIYFAGLTPIFAVGTSLIYQVFTKASGVVPHFKLGNIRKRRTILFLTGSIPGSLIGPLSVEYFDKKFGEVQVNTILQISMGIVVLFTAVVLIIQTWIQKKNGFGINASHSMNSQLSSKKKIVGITIGFLVGLIIGSTSIGGGILIIPALIIFLDTNTTEAVGTSLAISLVISILGGFVYIVHSHLDIPTTFLLLLGSLPGVYLGGKVISFIPEFKLRIIVILLVILSGLSLFMGLPS